MTIAITHTRRSRRGLWPSTADFFQHFNQRHDPPVERKNTTPLTATATAALVGSEQCPIMIT